MITNVSDFNLISQNVRFRLRDQRDLRIESCKWSIREILIVPPKSKKTKVMANIYYEYLNIPIWISKSRICKIVFKVYSVSMTDFRNQDNKSQMQRF